MQHDKIISNLVGVYGDERARNAVCIHEMRHRIRELTTQLKQSKAEVDRLDAALANSRNVERVKTDECARLRDRNTELATRLSNSSGLVPGQTVLKSLCDFYEFMPKNTEHEKTLAEDLRVLLNLYGRRYE